MLDFYATGDFKSETEKFWKNDISAWETAYFEEYNPLGRRTEVFSKEWNDTTQQFTEGYRIVSGYKKDTLLESELYQEWDVTSKAWKNLIRIVQEYNANDIITGAVQSVWKNDKWVNDYSIEYAFDAFGNLLSETTQDWDTVQLAWVNDMQIVRQYNSLGNVTNILRKKWDPETSAWINDVNRLISYDAFFQVSSDLLQKWNGSAWADSVRVSYTYDNEGYTSLYLEEVWEGGKWENVYREVYSYDSKEVTISINNWDAGASAWENDILITYFLDDQGYVMILQYDYWNSITRVYETGYYDEYEEDGTNPEYYEKTWNDSLNKFTGGIRVLSTYYDNATRDILQEIIQVWDTSVSEWQNLQKTDFFWSAMVSAEQLSQPGTQRIFPSPFTGSITIETPDDVDLPSTLRIFDLHGRIVSETALSGRSTVMDLSYLKRGVYFAEIRTRNGISVMKLMKN
jgi:hypothetical protein